MYSSLHPVLAQGLKKPLVLGSLNPHHCTKAKCIALWSFIRKHMMRAVGSHSSAGADYSLLSKMSSLFCVRTHTQIVPHFSWLYLLCHGTLGFIKKLREIT